MSREVDNMTRMPQSRLQKNSSSLSVATKDQAGSKFAFWKSKPATSNKVPTVSDELMDLDIQSALFPTGFEDDASQEGLSRLQSNAEHTIRRLKVAYQQNLRAFRDLSSEKNVLSDELEAAQTRGEHLKLQLADMAEQSATQESAMQAMAEELAALRHKIREDVEFGSKSLRIVTNESSIADGAESMKESHRRRKRHSAESFVSQDSIAESVFSHAPPGTCTPVSAADTSPELIQSPRFEVVAVEPAKECQNCHGVSRSEAWDVVHMLKEESKALKARIAQCESANEDALHLLQVVSGDL
jgi:hypothetical protein